MSWWMADNSGVRNLSAMHYYLPSGRGSECESVKLQLAMADNRAPSYVPQSRAFRYFINAVTCPLTVTSRTTIIAGENFRRLVWVLEFNAPIRIYTGARWCPLRVLGHLRNLFRQDNTRVVSGKRGLIPIEALACAIGTNKNDALGGLGEVGEDVYAGEGAYDLRKAEKPDEDLEFTPECEWLEVAILWLAWLRKCRRMLELTLNARPHDGCGQRKAGKKFVSTG
ncbi:hypothetical protein B0H13DRAFT_2447859 [Mycena leptocephala]|nr:hypothetical protein B0H13DRAFT_2447859 [Mycena leptocephala]